MLNVERSWAKFETRYFCPRFFCKKIAGKKMETSRSARHFPARDSGHFFARERGQPMSVRAKCQGVSWRWSRFAKKASLQKESRVLQTWIRRKLMICNDMCCRLSS